MFIRIVGLLYGLYISKYYTPPVRNVYDVYKELGILCFAAAADIDTFECILCSRRDKMNELINSIPGDNAIISTISRNSHTSGTIDQYYDIYSADDVKWIKKDQYLFIYSIGPDQEDNFADIRYSPTNGTCSRGDLIYLIDIGNEDNRDSISPVNSIKSP